MMPLAEGQRPHASFVKVEIVSVSAALICIPHFFQPKIDKIIGKTPSWSAKGCVEYVAGDITLRDLFRLFA